MNLEFKFLNHDIKTKLNLKRTFQSNVGMIPINASYIFNFFAESKTHLVHFLDYLDRLHIDFKSPSGKKLGSTNLTLRDFKSPLVSMK